MLGWNSLSALHLFLELVESVEFVSTDDLRLVERLDEHLNAGSPLIGPTSITRMRVATAPLPSKSE